MTPHDHDIDCARMLSPDPTAPCTCRKGFGAIRLAALHRIMSEGFWSPVMMQEWFTDEPAQAAMMWHDEPNLRVSKSLCYLELKEWIGVPFARAVAKENGHTPKCAACGRAADDPIHVPDAPGYHAFVAKEG